MTEGRKAASMLGGALEHIQRIESPSHPTGKAADQHVIDWASQHDLVPTAALKHKLEATHPGDLAACCYPNASDPVLFLTADWVAWLFVFDDLNDEGPLGRSPHEFRLFTDQLLSSVFGQATPNSQIPLVVTLSDIWNRIRSCSSPTWRDRFISHVRDYFDACVWQAANRATRYIPGMGDFPAMRRNSGAIWPSFDLIELATGLELPASVLQNRTYRRLAVNAADVVCWTNDLMTVEKELSYGDMHNMVTVTKYGMGCSLSTARELVEEKIERSLDEFLADEARLHDLCAELRLSTKDQDALVQYVAQLRAWMRGHVDWGGRTIRYLAPEVVT